MEGRLEHTIRTENNIKNILSELPSYVSDYYYSISVGLEPKSCEDYLRKIRRFLMSINKDTRQIDISKITNSEVARYLHDIEKKEDAEGNVHFTSFSYRKTVFTALNSFFTYLKNVGLVRQNPMANNIITRPKNEDNIKRIKLTSEDVKDILEAVNKEIDKKGKVDCPWLYRDRAILSLFINTGMRETALSEINLHDINFSKNDLTITDKRHKTHVYRLNDNLKEALNQWIEKRNVVMMGIDCDALFVSNKKQRISEKAVSSVVKKYSEKALGYKISPHKLRAAFCTILYENKRDIEFVRRAVGHSNIETTKRYIVSNNSARDEAASIMDDILNS